MVQRRRIVAVCSRPHVARTLRLHSFSSLLGRPSLLFLDMSRLSRTACCFAVLALAHAEYASVTDWIYAERAVFELVDAQGLTLLGDGVWYASLRNLTMAWNVSSTSATDALDGFLARVESSSVCSRSSTCCIIDVNVINGRQGARCTNQHPDQSHQEVWPVARTCNGRRAAPPRRL